MDFSELLKLCASADLPLKDDSRKVEKGDIFVAIPGEDEDGAKYIDDAIKRGAAYIVCAADAASSGICKDSSCTVVLHDDPRDAVARLGAVKWGTQDIDMRLIGVTGTNGKTTSAWMLDYLFETHGHRCGLLGTIKYKWPDFEQPAPLTTPGALQLQQMIHEMALARVDTLIMEVSSHALVQKRVNELPFSGALFTNLTQDHLDFHKDMETYFRAKARLFLDLPKREKAMAINQDDPYGRRLLELLPDAIAYGLFRSLSAIRQLLGEIVSSGQTGLQLKMSYGNISWKIDSPLIGEFNAMNLLGVQALGLAMGLPVEDFAVLEDFHGVPGRLERIRNPLNKHIFVDYAHTPDALINVLKALRKSNFKRIITVFGCGGNRDRSKRPLMGKAVADYSDIAVLTSDNPRKEDPLDIINDVLPGLANSPKLFTEPDRRTATEMALNLLQTGDALLIAGKGHEDYQIIGTEKIHYSDQEVVRELLGCE